MSAGDPSPWSSSYTGPWTAPGPPSAAQPGYVGLDGGNFPVESTQVWVPGYAQPVSDAQLRALPPPVGMVSTRPDQRPALVGLSVCLSVTAGLLWVCGLSLFWLVALAGTRAISPIGDEGYVFHTLDSFVLRMGDGLWFPLYGFPVVSVVSGFLLLVRRPWTRLAHTVIGAAALGWAAWWLRDSLLAWAVVALYVGVAVAVLWAPSVRRWYAGGSRPSRPPVQLTG